MNILSVYLSLVYLAFSLFKQYHKHRRHQNVILKMNLTPFLLMFGWSRYVRRLT